MQTVRHYFIGQDLDDLEQLETQLEAAGISTPQIHLLTSDDEGAAGHYRLHAVQSLLKKDVMHAAQIGCLIGLVLALLILLAASVTNLPAETVGWTPFVFLAIVTFGFCTWEGGLFGIQETNSRFKQFEEALESGKHLLFVDIEESQELVLTRMIEKHPALEFAGLDKGSPTWIHDLSNWFNAFVDRNLLSQSQVNH